MKILLTGMTSTQCNPVAHSRVGNYAGYLVQAFREMGHEVDWRDPRMNEFLDDYDAVIVGLAPLGSLGANRAYGALDVIAQLNDDPRLRLLVDAPDPEKLETGLMSMMNSPEKLFKEFFAYRQNYELASAPSARQRLLETVDRLANDTWPDTIVPALPWTLPASVETRLPDGARGKIKLHCLDVLVFDACGDRPLDRVTRPHYWAYEPSSYGRWLGQQSVAWPVVKVPRSSKIESDKAALQVLRDSAGCLIAPGRHGTWWNTRFAQSLSQGTPVFTFWEEARYLDHSFTLLPANYEVEPDEQIVENQLKSYQAGAGERDALYRSLTRTLERK
jgi:hypothetical protein